MKLVMWTLACDEPGCPAAVDACRATDREAIDATIELANADGWRIEHDRFIRPRLDLCPEHRGS